MIYCSEANSLWIQLKIVFLFLLHFRLLRAAGGDGVVWVVEVLRVLGLVSLVLALLLVVVSHDKEREENEGEERNPSAN